MTDSGTVSNHQGGNEMKGFLRFWAVGLLFAAFILAGCQGKKAGVSGTAEEKAAEEKIIFKLSHTFTPLQPTHLALMEAAKKINERTNGQIVIQVFADGEIANGLDGAEQCVRGAYFINVYDPSCMADWVPDYSALIGPMLYQSGEEYSAVCRSDFAQSLNKKAESAGLKVLALDYNFGMRHLVTAKKQVKSLADIQTLKLRVPKSQLWIETFTALGVSPVAIGWGELYNSLQSGIVDAYETSLSDTLDTQMNEVAKYVTKTGHFIGTGAVMMSKAVFDKLTPEQQKIFQEEFTAGAIRNNEMANAVEKDAEKQLKDRGMVFNEIDLTEMRVKARAAFDKFPNLTPGVYDAIVAEIAKVRKP
jgi:TRAP-type C4-dicarboxylate transport system substrate-binding protein